MSDRRKSYQRRSGAMTKALRPSGRPTSAAFYAPSTPGEGAALLDDLEDERSFQRWVIAYAELRGWRCWHDNYALRNSRGLPDLIMARGQRLVFAELKTEAGRVRPEQREWLAQLLTIAEVSNGAMDVYIWRPSDRQIIERILA